jgi:hypothetical protein
MSQGDDLVSVYKGANTTDAYMIRNALIEEGIECRVSEVNEPFAGLSVALPDVLVRASDEQRARQIIEDMEQTQIKHAAEQLDDEDFSEDETE